jgi:hypothetical protein
LLHRADGHIAFELVIDCVTDFAFGTALLFEPDDLVITLDMSGLRIASLFGISQALFHPSMLSFPVVHKLVHKRVVLTYSDRVAKEFALFRGKAEIGGESGPEIGG